LVPVGVSIEAGFGGIIGTWSFNELSWVIYIIIVWKWSFNKSKSPKSLWSNSEIVQDQEVSVNTSGGLNNTDLEISKRDQFSVNEMVSLSFSWLSVHDIKLWVFISERDSWDHIGTEINTENEDGGKWKWNLEQDEEDERKDLRNVG